MIIPLQRASSWKHVFIEMTSCHLATYRFELNIPLNYIYHESPTRFVKNPWRLRSGAIFLLLMVPLTSPELQMVPSNIQAMPGEPFFVKQTQDMEGRCQNHTTHLIWGPFLLPFFSPKGNQDTQKIASLKAAWFWLATKYIWSEMMTCFLMSKAVYIWLPLWYMSDLENMWCGRHVLQESNNAQGFRMNIPVQGGLPSWKLTWNLKMPLWKTTSVWVPC